jgi:hypothetical protein
VLVTRRRRAPDKQDETRSARDSRTAPRAPAASAPDTSEDDTTSPRTTGEGRALRQVPLEDRPTRPRSPDDTDTLTSSPFDLAPSMHDGEDTGSVRLGPFERLYESIFAEALEGGEISGEERERLDMAAKALGLDAARVAKLEQALLDAWEADIAETLVDPRAHADPGTLADRAPSSAVPPPYGVPSFDDESPTLARPSKAPPATSRAGRDTGARALEGGRELPFRELQARYDAAKAERAIDDQWRIAEVLVQRGAATRPQRAFWESHRRAGPVRPTRPLSHDAWTHLLVHPDQDRTTSEVFGVIAAAALVGRVSAMRRDGALPRLDPESYQNPLTSTVSAVRAISWAAATLGIRPPPVYVEPSLDAGFEIVTVVPPSTRIGARVLSGLSSPQLAFHCGRHLSWYREEHFVCTLVPSVPYLETIFYAALLLGAPALTLPDDVRERARVFSTAIVPCLEPKQLERLRRLVARFLARGGRTNLKRWARACEWTACRTGLLLCGELGTAADALANEPGGETRITELETFWASEEAGELRRRLGVALG